MRVGTILSLFALFFIISVPSVFADTTIVPVSDSGTSSECENTSQGCFLPPSVVVSPFDIVTFVNTDNVVHTFTSGDPEFGADGSFDSGLIHPGDSYDFSVTIWNVDENDNGYIDYFCIVHPWMIGTIIVDGNTSSNLVIQTNKSIYEKNDDIRVTLAVSDSGYNMVFGIKEKSGIVFDTDEFWLDGKTNYSTTFHLGNYFESGATYIVYAIYEKGYAEVEISASSWNDERVSLSPRNNIGEIQWLESTYPIDGIGKIRIIDADLDVNNYRDKVIASVYSDSDPRGIHVTLTETSTSGIFEGVVSFTTSRSGEGLFVGGGDTVTAEYLDDTLPAPYTSNDVLDISAITFVGQASSHLDRYSSTNLRITDEFGNMLDTVSPNQQVNLEVTLTNLFPIELQFAYWIDISGAEPYEYWVTSSLESGQTATLSQTWTPPIAGTYSITAHVVDSIVDKNFLAESQIMSISVSDYPPRGMSYSDVDVIIERNTGIQGCENSNSCYTPYRLSIDVGDKVDWYNEDSTVHTVTSGNIYDGPTGDFMSGLIMAGESYYHKFRDSGTFDYFCTVHPWMTGIIQVSDSNISTTFTTADIVECGSGTELVNGVCEIVQEPLPICGPPSKLVNGVCVMYDNDNSLIETEEKSSKGGGCLIATATYGSEMSPQVQLLREIRDNQLLNTESGSAFMGTFNNVYYSFSPYIADMERESPMFKEVVKISLTPMLSSLAIMENAESESEVIGFGLSVIALNLGMYLGVPAFTIIVIRNKI